MIESLKKFPKTWKKFEEYIGKFNLKERNGATFTFEGDELDIYDDASNNYNFHEVFKLPPQMLIGCLMEFLEENDMYVSYPYFCLYEHSGDIGHLGNAYDSYESAVTKAFEILEERDERI